MFKANLLYILLLQLNLYGFSRPSPSFLAVPKSAIVRIRTNVSLECSVNSTQPVSWEFTNVSHHNKENVIFFNGRIPDRLKSRYRINSESKGQFDLVIDVVDHEHAGKYTCTEFPLYSKTTAEITVIDSDPVCGMNMTNTATDHIVSLWCEINSTGFLFPQMKWTKDKDAIENNTTQSTTINGSITTTSFVRLQLQPQDNNTIERIAVKCTTSFMWKNGSTERVPHYEHVWRHTLSLPVTTDSSPRQLEVWIIAVGGCSIVIIILIILCIVFQRRKKKGSSKNSSSQSTSNPDVLHHDSLPPHGSNSRNAEESAKAPVQYDAVIIYAEVNKEPKKKEPKIHTETKTSSKTAQNKGQAGIVGEDGTVYMDFSGAKQTDAKKAQSKSPQKAQSKSQQFSQVELYACVDHTLFAPPHPPNSANGKKSSMH